MHLHIEKVFNKSQEEIRKELKNVNQITLFYLKKPNSVY